MFNLRNRSFLKEIDLSHVSCGICCSSPRR